ncbi:MAG: sirohydrochlorin chelatase [Brasilonema octagenarum HA4186-MV1]|jgi:sirohydrochlorin ferrochelatase|uniref:Sirohydrochlorin chelatase n=1 Tax=Brasilonema octagenarum UFV-OR1 TaxID=417115 RepID=A0ABX1MBQ2_9CYAN|nr:sirohydrochlorin chelatase [Brasilonema octagenarum]MBW4629950.1 sirohydrochlorin chelatase [Brasilonema octagenarum HA4186-MV1]NMF64921.1 sirohydrochlorin chelatase [Brasilonema octagenarum UFV-OR1]
MASAHLLVSHGSHDPRPEIAIQHLVELLCHKIQSDLLVTTTGGITSQLKCQTLVGTAYLELNPEPLHKQIIKFAKNALDSGCDSLKIQPLFLLPGVHVMEDIPAQVALAQQAIGQNIKIFLQPYLGSHPGLECLLAKQLIATKAEAKILLAHGSRRLEGNVPVEAMAAKIGAVAAYLGVSPSLEARVQELVGTGYKNLAIIPYFLFPGGMTDTVAQKQQELKLQFPEVNFQLTEPLGASKELVELIWDLLK